MDETCKEKKSLRLPHNGAIKNDSVDKELIAQACRPEFNPQNPHKVAEKWRLQKVVPRLWHAPFTIIIV